MHTLTITCPRGLETTLADEIASLMNKKGEIGAGFVTVKGDLPAIYQLNLHLRTASRVLLQVTEGTAASENDLYQLAGKVNWGEWFAVEKTIRVRVEGKASWCRRFDFLALKIKDAVCDTFTAAEGARPNVAKHNPDIRIVAHIHEKKAQIYLDTSGEALFKRGWRQDTDAAPIRENLAAGLLLLAGYSGREPFLDPLCGSGTIAIEAALLATNTPPGLRRKFAFSHFRAYDEALWARIHAKGRAGIVPAPAKISASDSNPHSVAKARRNAESAEVGPVIHFNCLPFQQIPAQTDPGILVANPPYGERLEAEIAAQYPEWATVLKRHFPGWTAGFITSDLRLPKLMRLKPGRKIPLFNGALECRFFIFKMVAGSNR